MHKVGYTLRIGFGSGTLRGILILKAGYTLGSGFDNGTLSHKRSTFLRILQREKDSAMFRYTGVGHLLVLLTLVNKRRS